MNICADDYGLDAKINDAILNLIKLKKISSVSVLIKKCSSDDIASLKSGPPIGIGLHLDLFKNQPLMNYLKFMFNRRALVSEINEQIRLFKFKFGFFPHYIDGHMHCQIYPFIREPLIRIIAGLNLPADFYIRSCNIPDALRITDAAPNTVYLSLLTYFNKGFILLLQKYGVNTNNQLYGAFNGHLKTEKILESFKLNGKEQDLFFFHPGTENIQL